MIADAMQLDDDDFGMHNNDNTINNNYNNIISSNKKQNANINDNPPILVSIPAQVSYQ